MRPMVKPLLLSLVLLAGLAFAGYLVWTVLPAHLSWLILVWVVAAAVVHDLIMWPAYTVADRATRRHPAVNFVRVPVVLSAVMLIISWPLVTRHSEASYHFASGLTENVYLARWLILSGAAFAASALLYGVRKLTR